jgi:hypothetical protein
MNFNSFFVSSLEINDEERRVKCLLLKPGLNISELSGLSEYTYL